MNRISKPRFDVTTVGETLIRLSVPVGQRLALANSLDLHVAGAEANVVGALAQLGHHCGWVSALPNSPLGQRVPHAYRFSGLDMTAVNWVENGRMATMFIEFGAQPRPTQVYYDRKNSSLSHMSVADIDWAYLLDSRLIHLTGITPALSQSCCEIILEVIKRAKAANIAVSFDINYRSKLWSGEKARDTLEGMITAVELLFCSQRDAAHVFEIHGEAEDVLQQMAKRFKAKHLVMSAGANGVYGWVNGRVYHTLAVAVDIVDRIGAGDAMAAGVLHGWLNGDFAKGLQYGALTAACVMSQVGDMLLLSRQELDNLLLNQDSTLSR